MTWPKNVSCEFQNPSVTARILSNTWDLSALVTAPPAAQRHTAVAHATDASHWPAWLHTWPIDRWEAPPHTWLAGCVPCAKAIWPARRRRVAVLGPARREGIKHRFRLLQKQNITGKLNQKVFHELAGVELQPWGQLEKEGIKTSVLLTKNSKYYEETYSKAIPQARRRKVSGSIPAINRENVWFNRENVWYSKRKPDIHLTRSRSEALSHDHLYAPRLQ